MKMLSTNVLKQSGVHSSQPEHPSSEAAPRYTSVVILLFCVGAACTLGMNVVYGLGVRHIPKLTLRTFGMLLSVSIGDSIGFLFAPYLILLLPQLVVRMSKRNFHPASYLRCYVVIWVLCIAFQCLRQMRVLH